MSYIASDRWYYANTAADFIRDAHKGDYIGKILEEKYEREWKEGPNLSLLHSYHASPIEIAAVLERGLVRRDQMIVLEYQLDSKNRIDCLICGFSNDEPNVVILETKEWDELYELRKSEFPGMIEILTKAGWKTKEHPSIQALRYRERMAALFNSEFSDEEKLRLTAYAYLHNCDRLSQGQREILNDEKFGDIPKQIITYTKDFRKQLAQKIQARTYEGRGMDILDALEGLDS